MPVSLVHSCTLSDTFILDCASIWYTVVLKLTDFYDSISPITRLRCPFLSTDSHVISSQPIMALDVVHCGLVTTGHAPWPLTWHLSQWGRFGWLSSMSFVSPLSCFCLYSLNLAGFAVQPVGTTGIQTHNLLLNLSEKSIWNVIGQYLKLSWFFFKFNFCKFLKFQL